MKGKIYLVGSGFGAKLDAVFDKFDGKKQRNKDNCEDDDFFDHSLEFGLRSNFNVVKVSGVVGDTGIIDCFQGNF